MADSLTLVSAIDSEITSPSVKLAKAQFDLGPVTAPFNKEPRGVMPALPQITGLLTSALAVDPEVAHDSAPVPLSCQSCLTRIQAGHMPSIPQGKPCGLV